MFDSQPLKTPGAGVCDAVMMMMLMMSCIFFELLVLHQACVVLKAEMLGTLSIHAVFYHSDLLL